MDLIPAIDIRGGNCVRLYKGDYSKETIFSDDPLDIALRWQKEGAATQVIRIISSLDASINTASCCT